MAEIHVKVETEQPLFKIEKEGSMYKASLTEKPENGRANAELIVNMSKILGKKVAIIEGHQKPRKKIKTDLRASEIQEKIEAWSLR